MIIVEKNDNKLNNAVCNPEILLVLIKSLFDFSNNFFISSIFVSSSLKVFVVEKLSIYSLTFS